MGDQFSFRAGDVITIIIYFAGLIGLGLWTTKKINATEDYFVGGRAMPGWAVGISLLGTAISSVTFLAYPGSAFEGNWSRLVPGFMLPIAAVIAIIFFVVFYRRSGFVSAYEYFEARFGGWGRTYASFVYILYAVFRIGDGFVFAGFTCAGPHRMGIINNYCYCWYFGYNLYCDGGT